MKYAQIAFAGNMEALYDFKTDIGDLEIGDPVVCHTARGYSVGKVVKLISESKKATDWIVQRVDVDRYNALIRQENPGLDKELEEMLGL